jgi:hypothetical protein
MEQDPFGAKTYAAPEETAERLERSSFVVRRRRVLAAYRADGFRLARGACDVPADGRARRSRAGMPEAETTAFALEVAWRMPALETDYVRLNIRARRA